LLATALCAGACADATGVTRTARPAAAARGNAEAAPSLAALPDVPGAADTPRTHQALLAARQALDAVRPAAPTDRSYASLQRWIDSDVVAWVEQRRAQTDATRDRFLVEGEPSAAERIVSHAVISLIDEDTARALADIPAPSELANEPDIAAMYRDVMHAQAGNFMSAALRELSDCADEAADAASEWSGFERFCRARLQRLQREQASTQPAAPTDVAAQ
jgi:hypothetical protein